MGKKNIPRRKDVKRPPPAQKRGNTGKKEIKSRCRPSTSPKGNMKKRREEGNLHKNKKKKKEAENKETPRHPIIEREKGNVRIRHLLEDRSLYRPPREMTLKSP